VALYDPDLVQRIKTDLESFAALGGVISAAALVSYCDALDEVILPLMREASSARSDAEARMAAAMRPIEEDLIRARLARGPLHAVFTDTILYLLNAHGALSTVDLHPLVKSIHPDLCDDSVDRVIDGKRFGKKWKHAVRSAQQQLKQRGLITYDGAKWRLVR
jgi:hypothetical protein